MRRSVSKLLLGVWIFLLSFIVASPAFAEQGTIDPVQQLTPNDGITSSLVMSLNNELRSDKRLDVDYDILTYNYGNGQISFDVQDYDKSPLTQRRIIMKTLLSGIANSNMAPLQKTKFYNFVEDRDSEVSRTLTYLQANTSNTLQRGEAFFSPAAHFIGTVVGIVVYAIAILMSLSIAFDMAYMVTPPIRSLLDRTASGKGPWGISTEAITAIRQSEQSGASGNWKGYMPFYLKTRGLNLMVIACILVLITTGGVWEPFIYVASCLGF